jgi:uncharacterized SAM-binding protein YcdF (DUF218 family)
MGPDSSASSGKGGSPEQSMSAAVTVPEALRADVEALWAYHDMGHEARRCDIGIGLGSHDLGVATRAAELFRHGMFPGIVFTGANAPTTVERFPRGEAVHYREHAIELGVPAEAIRVETRATNTGENIRFTRALLAADGIEVRSAMLVSRPYQQRRAYATARRVWPGLEVVCASSRLSLDDYVAGIGDARRVIDMLVGDTQRVIEYPGRGFAIPQEMPVEVRKAYDRLVRAGFTRRLLPRGSGPRPR